MNKTKIDWCDSSWNPVTGCLHGCEYCYAWGIVKRFMGFSALESGLRGVDEVIYDDRKYELNLPKYKKTETGKVTIAPYPYGFTPTFHKYRLGEYEKKKGRTIFVCSMGDLFGEFIPDEWIQEVFAACKTAPQHRYLFLTKNPKRYRELKLPESENFFFGTSITSLEDGANDKASALISVKRSQRFLSIEPLRDNVSSTVYAYPVSWVIIGAESGNCKNKIVPEREWIENITNVCGKSGTPVFMKKSLAGIWGEPLIQQFPWVVTV